MRQTAKELLPSAQGSSRSRCERDAGRKQQQADDVRRFRTALALDHQGHKEAARHAAMDILCEHLRAEALKTINFARFIGSGSLSLSPPA